MNYSNYPIPIQVIDTVQDYLSHNYPTLNEQRKIQLTHRLILLWIYISICHSNEKFCWNKYYDRDTFRSVYTNIHREDFKKYELQIDGYKFRYNKLLSMLEEMELIDINKAYKPGEFPRSYRPNQDIDFGSLQKIALDFKKLTQSFRSKWDLLKANPDNDKIIKDLYLVKIDLEAYFNKVDSLLGQVYKFDRGRGIILTDNIAYDLKIRAVKVNLGIHSFTESSTGRHYTSIANLPSLAIPFIKLNGNPVVEIDAKNCQPLLLNIIIDNEKFKDHCERGIFYDTMANHIGTSRKEFKLLSFGKVFFNNKLIKGKLAKSLNEVYPGLVDQINKYKFTSKKLANEAGEEKTLWYQLQKFESQIFVASAKLELKPVLTRHDSILIDVESSYGIVERVRGMFRKFGIKVNLKVT